MKSLLWLKLKSMANNFTSHSIVSVESYGVGMPSSEQHDVDRAAGSGEGQRLAIPRQTIPFRSERSRNAASVFGQLLGSASAVDLTDEQIDCSTAICALLVTVEDESGMPVRDLYTSLSSYFSRNLVHSRLEQLIHSGVVRPPIGRLRESNVVLTEGGHVGLILTPLVADALSHHTLRDVLGRFIAGLDDPKVGLAERRQQLHAFRGLVQGWLRAIRDVIASGDVRAAIELGKTNTRDLRESVHAACERASARLREHRELSDDIDRMISTVVAYLQAQADLSALLSREAAIGQQTELSVASLTRAATISTVEELAALWDGITFDSAPIWLDPSALADAADELLLEPEPDLIPECPQRPAPVLPEPREVALRITADELLGEAGVIDLTCLLASRSWTRSSALFADLIELSALDVRYRLIGKEGPPLHGDTEPAAQRPAWVSQMQLRRDRLEGEADG